MNEDAYLDSYWENRYDSLDEQDRYDSWDDSWDEPWPEDEGDWELDNESSY